ncbi:hypothetical protein N7501_007982 [Penicillium viridicatum]|nr:hypothetical protein N7501_007982 [Penicillium viridicatum]
MDSIILLNNSRLEETPYPSAEYNKLPHIENMSNAAAEHSKYHAVLLGIIAAHGLQETFSLHLVHKHFDLPEGRFMVYENVQSTAHNEVILCSPRLPVKYPNVRGLYFKAVAEGRMAAYEFTTEPGVDLSAHEDFVAKFSSAVIKFGVQDIFALTAVSICPEDKVLTEFEMAHVLSTVLVTDASWLPTPDMAASTSTDWIATQDYEKYAEGPVPGIIQLQCMTTRSTYHTNVKCKKSSDGKHYQQKKRPEIVSGGGSEECILEINGEVLHCGSEPHAIVSHALSLVDVI